MTQSPVIEVPPHRDILRFTAEHIIQCHTEDGSADFSRLFVLLPQTHTSKHLSDALLQTLDAEHSAIIPPWSGTLSRWAVQFIENLHPEYDIISEHSRQLLFIEALQQHPDLFKEENQWQVTQALLQLFDELSLNKIDLFESEQQLRQRLQTGYGMEDSHQHLLYESKLVYTLWHAWQQQLTGNALQDETADYISRLKNAAAQLDQGQLLDRPAGHYRFICLGLSHYSGIESDFIQQLMDRGLCQLIDFAPLPALTHEKSELPPASPAIRAPAFSCFVSDCLSKIENGSAGMDQSRQPLKTRTSRFAQQFDRDKLDRQTHFSTFLASDEEQQIRAIDYFIRENIIAGKQNIAIISEDRKLSRRLRALLERAGIPLQDKAGWSLATTQASTIIERWLECIEEDFNAYPLLDCLKSPYFDFAPQDSARNKSRENFSNNIYRFEHDLVFHENISSNIAQYRSQLKKRLARLSHWPQNSYDELIEILDTIETTAAPLSAHYAGNKPIKASHFLRLLMDSLDKLGILQRLASDEAGLLLLNTFEILKHSTSHADPELDWQECRMWLGMALEKQHFTPSTAATPVQLITLEQSACLHFDCLVIAACEAKHFPGSANSSPFFNQAVRASLQLDTWEQQHEQRQLLFERALLSAPELLITACAEEKGEEKPVSPWLELMMNFHQLAFGTSTENQHLHQLVASQTEVFNCDDEQLPACSQQAKAMLESAMLPPRTSASAYQRLINCPYQYFCADGLQLKALEELSDELKKSDYGERIHFILHVFHHGHDRFAPAFAEAITEKNRKQAEATLTEISKKVFHKDLQDNVLHRSWLHRWQKHIPAYISWQIQQQQQWNTWQSEQNLETKVTAAPGESLTLYGRLDRIDISRSDQSHAIIDYKTGRSASQQDIDSGENVQLSMYSLLDEKAELVSYLSVDSSDHKVQSRSSLAGDELQANRELNRQRLLTMFSQIKAGQTLTAWGDETVCGYCDFSGLCRRDEWQE